MPDDVPDATPPLDEAQQRAWAAFDDATAVGWLDARTRAAHAMLRDAFVAGWAAAQTERNEHIWDLYHGLNMSLPSFRGGAEGPMERVLPDSFEHFQIGTAMMDTHGDCCGQVYDDGFTRGIRRAGEGAVET